MTSIKLTIDLPPRTKKNHQRIVMNKRTGRPMVLPSKAYSDYSTDAFKMIPQHVRQHIQDPVNIEARFYMDTRRRVDLVNLIQCLLDVLVAADVIADDNARIVVGLDGSGVFYDKDRPRTEVEIRRVEC